MFTLVPSSRTGSLTTPDFGLRVEDSGSWAPGLGPRVRGLGFKVADAGFGFWGGRLAFRIYVGSLPWCETFENTWARIRVEA